MTEYYLIIRHYGFPINNWGYEITEVVFGDDPKTINKDMFCGQYSPDEAIQKGRDAFIKKLSENDNSTR